MKIPLEVVGINALFVKGPICQVLSMVRNANFEKILPNYFGHLQIIVGTKSTSEFPKGPKISETMTFTECLPLGKAIPCAKFQAHHR